MTRAWLMLCLWTVGLVALLVVAACSPQVPDRVADQVHAEGPGAVVDLVVKLGGSNVYRIVDRTNGLVCYLTPAHGGIACVKS